MARLDAPARCRDELYEEYAVWRLAHLRQRIQVAGGAKHAQDLAAGAHPRARRS